MRWGIRCPAQGTQDKTLWINILTNLPALFSERLIKELKIFLLSALKEEQPANAEKLREIGQLAMEMFGQPGMSWGRHESTDEPVLKPYLLYT